MRVRLASGEVADVSTGIGRRLVQNEGATEVNDKVAAKPAVKHDDDKPQPKSRAKGPEKDRGADAGDS